jgi:glycosyltransferase involved in cell wall biosynthesis
MILFDTTSASSWKHASGLARVSRRLLEELGPAARVAQWPVVPAQAGANDWILTPELFSEAERPGLTAFLEKRPFRIAAIYHDAIPIKHPLITWPKSVERHPDYMRLLARFDRVWAVSRASREELLGFWKWQGVPSHPPVEVIPLGADWPHFPRARGGAGNPSPVLKVVATGILEPRKNQGVLLDACEALRREGLEIELHLVGRVNPHFGGAIVKRIKALSATWPGLRHHKEMGDAGLAALLRSATVTAFPSIAEGCGLPLLESLWMGIPCVCSDIAAVAENAAGGGCLVVKGNAAEAWAEALRRVATDKALYARLVSEAAERELPTWAGAASVLRGALV